MKLIHSPTSPFVRKCLIAARELGLIERLELVPGTPHPVNRDASIVAHNPLGKLPTLIADDGAIFYDSRVICEYLNDLAGGSLLPPAGPQRWRAHVDQCLADGIMDAAVLVRYETAVRPQAMRWTAWIDGQLEKVRCGLDEIERHAAEFGNRVDVGTITMACALGYLDFRFASLGWRATHPASAAWYQTFSERPSMLSTQPPPT